MERKMKLTACSRKSNAPRPHELAPVYEQGRIPRRVGRRGATGRPLLRARREPTISGLVWSRGSESSLSWFKPPTSSSAKSWSDRLASRESDVLCRISSGPVRTGKRAAAQQRTRRWNRARSSRIRNRARMADSPRASVARRSTNQIHPRKIARAELQGQRQPRPRPLPRLQHFRADLPPVQSFHRSSQQASHRNASRVRAIPPAKASVTATWLRLIVIAAHQERLVWGPMGLSPQP